MLAMGCGGGGGDENEEVEKDEEAAAELQESADNDTERSACGRSSQRFPFSNASKFLYFL